MDDDKDLAIILIIGTYSLKHKILQGYDKMDHSP